MSQSSDSPRPSEVHPPVEVFLEFTPDPNELKYAVSPPLLMTRRVVAFSSKEEAASSSPLAAQLFTVPSVISVVLGANFISVRKTEEGDWDEIHRQASSLIERYLLSGRPVMDESANLKEGAMPADKEIEKKILDILENEIRPAIAMDGGDIEFEKYENGVVYVHLHGACRGCPGATMTLKMGVERRLQEVVPEVKQVVAV